MSSFFHLRESIKLLYQQLEYSERKVIADEAEMKRHARLAVLRKNNYFRGKKQNKLGVSYRKRVCPWLRLLLKTDPPRLGRKEGLAVKEDWNWGFILELLWFCWQYALVLAFSNGWLFRILVFSTLSRRHKDIKVPGAMLRKSACIKLVDFADGNVRLPNKFEF